MIEIEFADATLSTDFEIQNVRVLALQVVLDSSRVARVQLPTVHTQQSTVPPGVAEHNVTVARAFTKLMEAFVTFWNNDAGSKIHLLAIGAARQEDSLLESQMQLGSLQYPHNPMKGASEHFHFLSVLAGTYDDTVRNIDIDRATCGLPDRACPRCPSVASALVRATWLGSLLRRSTARGCVHPPDSLSAGGTVLD